MADNLVFPIGFDLEAGIKQAEKNADVALRRLETALNRKPLSVAITMDTSKFSMFERQFSNSINGIQTKLAQAQRLWNSMTFDVKFDENGNLSRRAQIVFDAFNQLTQASATMGQRLGEVNRQLAQSEAEIARLITAEYDKRKRQIDEQIRLKERQAAAEERVRQSQLKGVNAGYVDLQKQTEAVRNLRLQYEAILPMLNAMAQKRVDIKVRIDKQFEADVNRINAEIARLRQSNLQLGAKGDTNAIQANLAAIRQLEAELQRISQQKIDLLNTNKINSDISRLRTEIASVFGELQTAERKLASDNSLNAALDAQSQKVLNLHAQIQKLDQRVAQLNAQNKMYNADGSFTSQATALLQQRIALTKQLEQAAVTGQQAQIKLEQQLREEKRRTDQEAKQAAKEAERQAKAEAERRKANRAALEQERAQRRQLFETKRAQWQKEQNILNKEAKSIADITAQLQIQQQRLNNANVGSAKFNKIAEEVKRLTAELDKANQKMRELTGQTTSGAESQAKAVRQVSNEFKHQDGYVSRLIKRLAVYAGFQQITGFLRNVREVTAQFELQRVSLGAIIQDQTRANALFSEIKQFALKSPISIMDLTKYTKQVAAYRIETDKLFDTTKRLADVSVGLGVDMGRLVLAYGQVKAASYLRAAEIRQFTEAGIPMLELLAEKFTKLNGEAVSTEQVMEMVSKRMVGFEMVEDIFNDMTSAGGMFYNMQEKQGNTLFGLWAKLGDAASLMYDEIGNTGWVNEGMKGLIQLMTDLMKNWRLVGREATVLGATIAILYARHKLGATNTALVASATNQYTLAQRRLNAALKAGNKTKELAAIHSAKAAVANRAAAMSINAWTAAQFRLIAATNRLKAAFLGNWITLTIAAIAAIGAAIYSAYEKAHKLQNELKDIESSGAAESAKSVFNFERLANAALDAANGSKQQNDALAELKRTYKDIIPEEELTLSNLRRMREEGYSPLIAAIKEYIAQRTLQKEIDAITSHYTEDIIDKQRQLRQLFKQGLKFHFFKGVAWSPVEKLDDDQISQLFANVERIAKDKSKAWQDVWIEAIKGVTSVSAEQEAKMRGLFENSIQNAHQTAYNNMLRDIVDNTREMATETDAATKKMDEQTGALGRFLKAQENVAKRVADNTIYLHDGKAPDPDKDSYLLSQLQIEAYIRAIAKEIQNNTDITNALKQAGIEIKTEWFKIIETLDPNDLGNISLIDFDAIIAEVDKAIERLGKANPELKNVLIQLRSTLKGWKEEQQKMVPDEAVVKTWRGRWQAIAKSLHTSTNFMGEWLMESGEDFETYRKRIKEEIDRIAKLVAKLQNALEMQLKAELSGSNTKLSDEERKKKEAELEQLKKDQEALQKLYDDLAKVNLESPNAKNKGGRAEQDKRFELLKSEFSMVKKLYDEYKKMSEVIGGDKAAAKLNELYGSTLKMLAKRHKITLPTTIDETTASLDILLNKMKSLAGAKGKKGQLLFPNAQKEVEDFAMQVETLRVDEVRKNIEKKIKELADRISRTKTAREFYDKILGMTGDVNLASKVSMSIYGDDGFELQKQLADQVRQYFKNDIINVEIPVEVIGKNNSINYKKLSEFAEKYKKELGEKPYEAVKKIAEEGKKDLAKTYEGYFKDLEKAKTYASQRIELAQTTAYKIRQIRADMANNPRDTAVGENLISGLIDKEMRDEAKLEWEAFKGTPLYVQMFEDLEHASTSTLEMMRKRLKALSRTWGSALDPTQLKEMQGRMADITEQLRTRNPWKELKAAYRQYKDATESVTLTGAVSKTGEATKNLYDVTRDYGADSVQAKEAMQELKAREKIVGIIQQITAEQGKQVKGQEALTLAQQKAFDNEKIARGRLEIAVAELKKAENEATAQNKNPADDPGVKAARKRLGVEQENLDIAMRISNIFSNNAKDVAKWRKTLAAAAESVVGFMHMGSDFAKGIADTMDALGGDEYDVQYWNDISEALGDITAGFQGIVDSALSLNVGGIISSAIGVIPNMVKGFAGLFSAGKVRKANKEIRRQQELLEQLEYSYSRLEKMADKVFGADYINNYNRQQKNLEAQARAYQAQAAAERSKGKDADEAKIKEYENSYRETMDEIADMQGQIAAQMLGTDLASAARDFAKAWLDAYKEFSNTTGKMSEKFREMIENMVVEGALAKVMERALKPMFDMIDNMGDEDFYSQTFWKEVVAKAEQGAKDADAGAQTMMSFLEQAGISVRSLGSEMTGMTREIAGASEETMSGVAAALNTQNYYASHIPMISENVAAIRMLVEGGGAQPRQGGGVDTTALWNQHLELQQGIYRHTAETVAQCELIAKRCEAMASDLHRVIGSTPSEGAGLRVWINGR